MSCLWWVLIPDIFILGDHSTLSDANIGLQSIIYCITFVGLCFWCCKKKGQNMLINWCYDIVWWYQIDMLLRVMVECVQVLCGAADTWRVYIGPSLCLVSTPSIFAISKWIFKNVFSQNYSNFLKKHFSMRPCAKSGQEQLEKLRISGVRWGPVVFEKRPQYSTHVWIPWDSKTFQYRGFWEEAEFLN